MHDFNEHEGIHGLGAGKMPVPSVSESPRNQTETPKLPRNLIFGACAGLVLGSLSGAACCWIAGVNDYLAHGAAIGAAVGLCIGALIGFIERRRRGDVARPDIATPCGIAFGLIPGRRRSAQQGDRPGSARIGVRAADDRTLDRRSA